MAIRITSYELRITNTLFGISEVDLDFIDLFEDLPGVGFDVGAESFDFAAIIRLVEDEILFEVGEFDIDFGQTDFHMHPNGNNGHKKG